MNPLILPKELNRLKQLQIDAYYEFFKNDGILSKYLKEENLSFESCELAQKIFSRFSRQSNSKDQSDINLIHKAESRMLRIKIKSLDDSKKAAAEFFIPRPCKESGLYLLNGLSSVFPFYFLTIDKESEKNNARLLGCSDFLKEYFKFFIASNVNADKERKLTPQKIMKALKDLFFGSSSTSSVKVLVDLPGSHLASVNMMRTRYEVRKLSKYFMSIDYYRPLVLKKAEFKNFEKLAIKGLSDYEKISGISRCPIHGTESNAGYTGYLGLKKVVSDEHAPALSLAISFIPFVDKDNPERLIYSANSIIDAQRLNESKAPLIRTASYNSILQSNNLDISEPLFPGRPIFTLFAFYKAYNYEDGIVISKSAALKLALGRKKKIHYAIPWIMGPDDEKKLKKKLEKWKESRRVFFRGFRLEFSFDPAPVKAIYDAESEDKGTHPERFVFEGSELAFPARIESFHFTDEIDHSEAAVATPFRKSLVIDFKEIKRPAQAGDKIMNLHGNKGVISLVLEDDKMPLVSLPSGEKKHAELIANPIGVINRGNYGQIFEAVCGLMEKNTEECEFNDFKDQGRVEVEFGSTKSFYHAGPVFWMRKKEEAAYKARLEPCWESSKTKLPRSFRLGQRAFSLGEMDSFALSGRKGAAAFIREDLFKRRLVENDLAEDRETQFLILKGALKDFAFDFKLDNEESLPRAQALKIASEYNNKEPNESLFEYALSRDQISKIWRHGGKEVYNFFGSVNQKNEIVIKKEINRDSLKTFSEAVFKHEKLFSKKSPVIKNEKLKNSAFTNFFKKIFVSPGLDLTIVPGPRLKQNEIEIPWYMLPFVFKAEGRINKVQKLFEEHGFSQEDFFLLSENLINSSEEDFKQKRKDNLERLESLKKHVISCFKEEEFFVFAYRTPVNHAASNWVFRVMASADNAPAARVSFACLEPMGGDFDGDSFFLLPVFLPKDHEFILENQITKTCGKFNESDLDTNESYFGVSKDLKFAFNNNSEAQKKFENNESDLLLDQELLAKSLEMIDQYGEFFSLNLSAMESEAKHLKLLRDSKAVKDIFLQAFEGNRFEEYSSYEKLNEKLKRFFQRDLSTADLTSYFNTLSYQFDPEQDDEKLRRLFLAKGRIFAALQNKVLQFKGKKTPPTGAKLKSAFEHITGQTKSSSADDEAKEFLKELKEKYKNSFDVLESYLKNTDQTMNYFLKCDFNKIEKADLKISKNRPPFLFLYEDLYIKKEKNE